MPISLTPSPLVDIDMSDAGVDDFLRLTLANGERLYVRRHTGNGFSTLDLDLKEAQFTFDQVMLPRGFRRLSFVAARKFLRDLSDNERLHLEELYEARINRQLSLLSFVARELRREPSVKATRAHLILLPEPFNIGTHVEARLSPDVQSLNTVCFDPPIWSSAAPIVAIERTDRCDAMAEHFTARRSA